MKNVTIIEPKRLRYEIKGILWEIKTDMQVLKMQ